MKCPGCEKEAPSGSVFCPHCGLRLDPQAHDAPPASPAPANTGGPPQRAAAGEAGIYTEEELWTGRYSPKAMLATGIMCVLISIGLAVLGFTIGRRDVWFLVVGVIVLMLIAAALVLVRRRFGIRYRLTTQRFIQEKGIVTRQTDRIDIIDINDIRVEQGPIERLLEIGTMIVMANDRTDANLTMPGIENVNHVADLMDNARRAVQRRRGLRIDVNAPADAGDHGHPGT